MRCQALASASVRSGRFSEDLRPTQGLKHLGRRKVRPSTTGLSSTKRDHEVTMNPKPLPPGMHPLCTIIVAGTLSCLIAIGLVVGIVELFLRDGTPLQTVIIAQ